MPLSINCVPFVMYDLLSYAVYNNNKRALFCCYGVFFCTSFPNRTISILYHRVLSILWLEAKSYKKNTCITLSLNIKYNANRITWWFVASKKHSVYEKLSTYIHVCNLVGHKTKVNHYVDRSVCLSVIHSLEGKLHKYVCTYFPILGNYIQTVTTNFGC